MDHHLLAAVCVHRKGGGRNAERGQPVERAVAVAHREEGLAPHGCGGGVNSGGGGGSYGAVHALLDDCFEPIGVPFGELAW